MATESETSFASLLSGALNDIRDLFRREIALARFEVKQEISKATTAIASFAAAAVVLLFGTLFILTAVARGFAMLVGWPIWAGFGIVGILLALVGAALFFSARSRLRTVNVVPRQTAETLKEDVQWLKQQTRSVRE
jgi:multidrug transporter EmrE-like cation transporter